MADPTESPGKSTQGNKPSQWGTGEDRDPREGVFASTDDQYREWQRSRGMERIVQGALRLAAHQVLGERPHFGGRYSERLIEEGIALIERAFKPPAPERPLTKKEKAARLAAQLALADLLGGQLQPSGRKKPWSSRDSRSYRDPKPEK
jgi:hypothetical protein